TSSRGGIAMHKGKWHRLTTAFCTNIKQPGKYRDSPNLIFRVDAARSSGGETAVNKSWGFRNAVDGIERTLGLGPWPTIGLADAREKAGALRGQKAGGVAPKTERIKARTAERAAAARLITFRDAAERFLADREHAWRNAQHRRDFRNSLDNHILPVIG